MSATDKRPYGGFAATLKGDRLSGFSADRELDRVQYYTTHMLARMDPVWRRRLNEHMAAQSAYRQASG